MKRLGWGIGLVALMMGAAWADAQTAQNLAVLKGLAPVSALSNSPAGNAALASNLTVTGGIRLRRLFPAEPLCRCRPRGRALARQALIVTGLQTALLIATAPIGSTMSAVTANRRALVLQPNLL